MDQKKAVLVLGMHRSGTSMITRIVSFLGATLPKEVLAATVHNKSGHWEPARIVNVNDRMLQEGRSTWADWRPFEPSVLGVERCGIYRDEIRRILAEEYDGAPLIVLKEPRICRFVPFYEEILADLGYSVSCLIANRDPYAVAKSLHRRNGMSEPFAWLLYLRHQLDSEFSTRGRDRSFVSYESVLADWRTQFTVAVERLDIVWPRAPHKAADEIEAYIQPQLQHHKPQDLGGEADSAWPWFQNATSAFAALENDPSSADAMKELDAIRSAFDEQARTGAFMDVMFGEIASRAARGSARRRKLRERLAVTEAQLAEVLKGFHAVVQASRSGGGS